MRTLLQVSTVAALVVAASTLLTGCPLAPSCGAFSGDGDTMFQRGADSVIVCENGGFSASLASGAVEGRYAGAVVTDGASGAVAFDFTRSGATASSTVIGDGWTQVDLDQTALDHADVLCTDLATRAWWSDDPRELPVATAFAKVAGGYATIAACEQDKAAGNLPENATCEDQLQLCPDGSMSLYTGDVIDAGMYSVDDGLLTMSASDFAGTYKADGSLVGKYGTSTVTVAWARVPYEHIAGNLSPCL